MPEWYLVALHILAFLGICWTAGFIVFTAMQKRSHPPIRDEQEETLAGETTVTVTCPPSYGLRIVR